MRSPSCLFGARLAGALVLSGVLGAALPVFGGDEESLFIAAREGHLDVVRARLDAGEKPDEAQGSWTPLQVAAHTGHADVVSLLLARGADPNRADNSQETGLHVAAHSGHADIVSLLLKAGAKVDPRNYAESTPLMTACRYGKTDVVRLLLAAGANAKAVDHVETSALCNAALARSAEIVGLLLAAGAEVDARDRILLETPLALASTYGSVDVIEKLLAAGAKVDLPDHEGKTPLWRASEQGHDAVVARLLARGADPARSPKDGDSPFVIAASRGHLAVEKLLVDKTPDIGPALVAASEAGHVEIVARLLERKANPDAVDRSDVSAMEAAARGAHLDVVDLLLRAGARIAAGGPAAAGAAAQANTIPVLRRLLEKGVSADARDRAGSTPLLRAVGAGSVEAVVFLLGRGASASPTDAAGRGIDAYMAASEGVLEARLEHMERSRALHRDEPQVRESLRDLKERHQKIRALLAKAAK